MLGQKLVENHMKAFYVFNKGLHHI